MSGYQGFNTQAALERAMQTTLARHIREVEEDHLRNFQLGAALESAGRIMYNQSGRGFDWRVRYRNHGIEGNTGETVRNFTRRNLWKDCSLEFRGYQATDMIYERELAENKGEEGVIKVYDGLVSRITESMREGLATEYWVDGNASGYETSWHGFESMFGTNGTVTISSGAQRAANDADLVMYPSDTYAGLSTQLGFYGGDNESGVYWPNGLADPEYDFYSPLIVAYNSTAFTSTNHTFVEQGDQAMRFAIINAQRNSSRYGQIEKIWLARNLYTDLLNLLDEKERIPISSTNSLRAMGFTNVVNFDGLEVTWEASVPSSVGYGMNLNMVSLRCLDAEMLRSEGPTYDIRSQGYLAVVSTLSNLQFASPRNFFKLVDSTP